MSIRQPQTPNYCYDANLPHFVASRQPWDRMIRVYGMLWQPERFITGFTTEPVVEDGRIGVPSFSLDTDSAQRLMDSLWDCGIRPTAGQGSAGQMAATERHLEDLRSIAYQALRFSPPQK
jgi:hypothetical protein